MNEYYGIKIKIKTQFGEREAFHYISENLHTTKQFGKGPYYRLTFNEAVEPRMDNYWGWKIFGEETYKFVHPLKAGVEICFSYGTKSEEKKRRGKLVELVLEDAIQIE